MAEHPAISPHGELRGAVSKAMVRLVAEYTGRGPTKARTLVGADMVVCLLEDTLTKGEHTLVSHGECETVLGLRRTFQEAMREDAVAAVERLTGRTVIAFMSENHVDPDLAVETFVLEAETGEPARVEGVSPA